jgi:hypothetical protein
MEAEVLTKLPAEELHPKPNVISSNLVVSSEDKACRKPS